MAIKLGTNYQLELTSREPIEVNDKDTWQMYHDIKKIAGASAGSTYEAIRKLQERPGYDKIPEQVKWQLLIGDVPQEMRKQYQNKGYTVDQVYAGLPPSVYREKQDVSPVPQVIPKIKTQPVTPVQPQSEPEPAVEPSRFNWLAEQQPMVQDTTFPYGYYGTGVINTANGTKASTNYPMSYLTYAK